LNVVTQVWLCFLRNATDFELADGYSRVRSVDVCVQTSAALELKHFVSRVDRPNARERRI